MITERTLRNWRLDALRANANHSYRVRKNQNPEINETISVSLKTAIEVNTRILRLTQELLDQSLLKKVAK